MNFYLSAAQTIEKCGESVQIIKGETTYNTMAVIQPLTYKNNKSFSNQFEPMGYLEDQVYIYIGKPDVGLDVLDFDTVINTKDNSYVVKRCEKFNYKGKAIYIWALLQKCVVEEQNGSV